MRLLTEIDTVWFAWLFDAWQLYSIILVLRFSVKVFLFISGLSDVHSLFISCWLHPQAGCCCFFYTFVEDVLLYSFSDVDVFSLLWELLFCWVFSNVSCLLACFVVESFESRPFLFKHVWLLLCTNLCFIIYFFFWGGRGAPL